MASMWPRLYKAIIDKERTVKLQQKDKYLSKLMAVLDTDIECPKSSDTEMALSLSFLPVLLPESSFAVNTAGKKSRKRSVWKPSIVETMEHFVDIKEVSLDLEQYLKTKGEKLASKGLKLQPHVVVLCDGMDNVGDRAAYYACLHESVFYNTTSLMEAVDVCIKADFVFGLQYPAAASACWTYVQRAVYSISSKYDRVPSRVMELITDSAVHHC